MNKTSETTPDLIVIGGGITGLSAAYIAAKNGKKVTVIEASGTFGGLLNTFEIGNNRLEFYYHHFFTHDTELNWLINELNLNDKLVFRKTSMGVFREGKLFQFNTISDLFRFKPISLTDKLRFGITSVFLGKIANWTTYENVTSIDWLRKWAGKSTTKSLWAPLLNIKFGKYASKVPLSWMIGRLRQRMNSRKKGTEELGYLDGSLQVLLDALLKKLQEMGVELVCNQAVGKIELTENKIVKINTNDNEYQGQNYLFTIPGIYLGKLLENDRPEYSSFLKETLYFGAICVILELDRPLSDIYWLNIADDGFPFGGIIEHTNFISAEKYSGSHIAYLSRYFGMDEEIAQMSLEEVKEFMLRFLPQIYPEFKKEWIKNVYVFKTNTAATVCDLNFSKKIPSSKTPLENMYMANMSHIYPDERSTNNSIRIAAETCKLMGMDISFLPKSNSLSGKIGFKR